jgi:hypothetical protein
MSTVRGSCLCGDVAWEATGPFDFMSHCHCSRCRKSHGSAFATFIMCQADAFRFVRGRDGIVAYSSSPNLSRSFCGGCGSVVPSEGQGLVGMPAGPLDDDPGVRPIAHIFVASKAPWYEVGDALPRFDAFPPGVDAPVLGALPVTMPPDDKVRGSCLCGSVAFVVGGPAVRCQHCHCSRCRKARAAAHASNLFVAADALRFERGESGLVTYKVPEARFFKQIFCGTCGSKMPRVDPERGFAVVPMGSLDGDPGARPNRHIYVGSKAPWVTIADDLPQYDEMPPA